MSDVGTRLRRLSFGLGTDSYPPIVLAGDPHIDSLTPSTVSAAAAATTITVHGLRFVAGSVVEINQAAKATTFVNATTLTISYDPTAAGTVQFTVRNPNNQESNSFPFVVGALADEPTPGQTGTGDGDDDCDDDEPEPDAAAQHPHDREGAPKAKRAKRE